MFSEVCLEHVQILFGDLVCILSFLADSGSKPSWRVSMNTSKCKVNSLFDLEPTKTIYRITSYSSSVSSNFCVIPICWLLTVNSEMASFLFRSLTEDLLVFF